MKRAILPALMIIVLSACAAQGATEADFTQWRESLSSVDLCATVTITQGDSAADYDLSCSYSPDSCIVKIVSPETLAGVTASRSAKETQLEYDGLILSLGEMDGISPINALPQLVDAIIDGHLEMCYGESAGEEKFVVAQLTIGETTTVHLWLESESMTPVRAEFESGENADIKAVITQWNIR